MTVGRASAARLGGRTAQGGALWSGSGGVHLPDQHFGVIAGGEALTADACEANGVSLSERAGSFQVDVAAGDEDVVVGGIGNGDGVTAFESCGV